MAHSCPPQQIEAVVAINLESRRNASGRCRSIVLTRSINLYDMLHNVMTIG